VATFTAQRVDVDDGKGVFMTTERQLRLLKCLSNETRFKILLTLKSGERCVCEIVKELGKEQSLISHHLGALRRCGLVSCRREGQKMVYALASPAISDLLIKISQVSKKIPKCVLCD
jgi:ArsR family transcriptional regulator